MASRAPRHASRDSKHMAKHGRAIMGGRSRESSPSRADAPGSMKHHMRVGKAAMFSLEARLQRLKADR